MNSSYLCIYVVLKKTPHADLVGVILQAPCFLVDEASLILKIVASFFYVENAADYPSRHDGGVV